MAQAETEAAAAHKNVLVIFSASWCGPCHLFEALLNDQKVAPIMGQSFIIVRRDVGEQSGDTHHADTPGAVALLSKLGGEAAGYPFIVATDASGRPIVDSCPLAKRSSNVGYPAVPAEIDWFMQMMQRSAPALTSEQRKALRKALEDRSPHRS